MIRLRRLAKSWGFWAAMSVATCLGAWGEFYARDLAGMWSLWGLALIFWGAAAACPERAR